jgi:hypothetical protein
MQIWQGRYFFGNHTCEFSGSAGSPKVDKAKYAVHDRNRILAVAYAHDSPGELVATDRAK